jgi:hypothetical protein
VVRCITRHPWTWKDVDIYLGFEASIPMFELHGSDVRLMELQFKLAE